LRSEFPAERDAIEVAHRVFDFATRHDALAA
jgi:hypothetical protein